MSAPLPRPGPRARGATVNCSGGGPHGGGGDPGGGGGGGGGEGSALAKAAKLSGGRKRGAFEFCSGQIVQKKFTTPAAGTL
jgi:hypothetical protein